MELLKSEFANRLIDGIVLSKREIRIFTYVLSFHFFRNSSKSTQVYLSLADAKRRGVDIRVIVDSPKRNRPNFNVNNFAVKKLIDVDIPVKMPSGGRTGHAKLAVFDNLFAILGSHNITDSSFKNPFELSIVVTEPELVKNCIDWFDVIWSRKTEDWGW